MYRAYAYTAEPAHGMLELDPSPSPGESKRKFYMLRLPDIKNLVGISSPPVDLCMVEKERRPAG